MLRTRQGRSRSTSPTPYGKRSYESDEEYLPSKRKKAPGSNHPMSKRHGSSSTAPPNVFARGEPVTVYRAANGEEPPHQSRVTLHVEGDLDTMATGWFVSHTIPFWIIPSPHTLSLSCIGLWKSSIIVVVSSNSFAIRKARYSRSPLVPLLRRCTKKP